MNKVLLTGRLTRDPELRHLATGRAITQFGLATNEYHDAEHAEHSEYHNIVVWGALAELAANYLKKGQQIAVEGRLQTRSWDDDRGHKHWKTEVVAASIEMLAARPKPETFNADAAAAAASEAGLAQ